MPKTAFHTLLEEESELKQHDCVFKPETSSALEQNAGVCGPFEGKPDCKQRRCTKGGWKHPPGSLKQTPRLILSLTQVWKMHTCSCKVWALHIVSNTAVSPPSTHQVHDVWVHTDFWGSTSTLLARLKALSGGTIHYNTLTSSKLMQHSFSFFLNLPLNLLLSWKKIVDLKIFH